LGIGVNDIVQDRIGFEGIEQSVLWIKVLGATVIDRARWP
jgi:hypothetical protein